MKASDIPTKNSIPFANTGIKNAIPIPSQISVTPGAASFTDGFPPLTFIPVASGGIPPAGADMNGVLFDTTAWDRWQQAGGAVLWDSAFSTAIGGYPKGSVVLASSQDHWWMSSADDNTSNPDTGGANWTQIGPFGNLASCNAGTGIQIVGNTANVVQGPGSSLFAFSNFH